MSNFSLTSSKFIILIIIVLLLSGCPSQKKYNKPIDKFANMVENATDVVKNEASERPSVRRDMSVVYFIKKGNDVTNLSAEDIDGSFARYVCTGVASYTSQLNALNFANEYAQTAKSLAKTADDSFAAQWAKYKELSKDNPDLVYKPGANSNSIREKCKNDVKKFIKIIKNGKVANDITDESGLLGMTAVFEKTTALIDSLKTLAKRGLKKVNDQKALERTKEYININFDNVQSILGSDLRPELINNAWNERMAQSLIRPYYMFVDLMEKNKNSINQTSIEIIKQSTSINLLLNEFDSMRNLKPPGKIISAIAVANAQLKKSFNEKGFAQESLWSFLVSFAEDLDDIKSEFEDINEKAEDSKKAFLDL